MDQVEQVKSKIDLVEVISSYLPLKKAGRNFAALCPFHSEKTPSLMVSPERQVFKCFGCGEAGDVFTFVAKMEGWDFREALEELAQKAGVKLTSYAPTGRSETREKLLAINSLISKFYAHLLNSYPLGAKARDYLLRRGIKKPLWEKFNLGYAPAGWENSLNFLKKRGFLLEDIATSGLIVARDKDRSSFYDRFRDRLIFPLKDNRGMVLGFSARVIDQESDKEPKYINSPETPVFNKGSLLFGLDVAKGAIRAKNEVLLVEGEFDVLSAHKVGIENVIASKGTALTDKQVATISRVCENVILCFDRDLAGDAASRRGIELLDLAQVNVKVVKLGQYKDPDEFCQKDPKGFKNAIFKAVDIYDYYIESASSRFDPKTSLGKRKIGQEVLPILAKISDDLVRAHYIEKLANILDLEVTLVATAVEKRLADLYVRDSSGGSLGFTKSAITSEEYFLALFISQEEVESAFLSLLAPEDFDNENARHFWRWLRDIIKNSKAKRLRGLLKKLPKNLSLFLDNLYLVNISPIFGEKELWAAELAKVTTRIKRESLRRQLALISKRLKGAQEKSDKTQIMILTKKFDELSRHLKEASF